MRQTILNSETTNPLNRRHVSGSEARGKLISTTIASFPKINHMREDTTGTLTG
ncbi:hypothetical protein [Oxalobacter paraformigenes]|nr:hypothetical protein [Oxalobacter paraformigenes]